MSVSAERAARQIVHAIQQGESERILTLAANLLARFHGLFPGLTIDLLGAANRWILPGSEAEDQPRRGADTRVLNSAVMRALTVLGRRAAEQLQPRATAPAQTS